MLETNILNSMIRKTKTARALLAEGQDVRFPGEYPFTIFGKKDEQYHNLKNDYKCHIIVINMIERDLV